MKIDEMIERLMEIRQLRGNIDVTTDILPDRDDYIDIDAVYSEFRDNDISKDRVVVLR